MIKVDLTVREAVLFANQCDNYGGDEGRNLRDRIISAIEIALGVNQMRDVTITKMPGDSRISCIRAIRLHSGWGLREAKEWTDVLVGRYDDNLGTWMKGAAKHTIRLSTPIAAEALLRDLTSLGCEGYLS